MEQISVSAGPRMTSLSDAERLPFRRPPHRGFLVPLARPRFACKEIPAGLLLAAALASVRRKRRFRGTRKQLYFLTLFIPCVPTHSHKSRCCRWHRKTRVPVPGLTSLYHKSYRGDYGDSRYPGNCSGELIKDLLKYFQPSLVFDPMTGSGTCKDVCRELGIACVSEDIRFGFDACDLATFPDAIQFDFIWIHPPYWRQKRYTDDPRDLSACATLDDFLTKYARLIGNCANALDPRRQARHPHGRLQRPRRGVRPAHVPHQAALLRGRPQADLHRHHPLLARCQQQPQDLHVELHPRTARRMHHRGEAAMTVFLFPLFIMHYCVFVLIPKDADIDIEVAKALAPFDDDLKVDPYKVYLDPQEITRMARHYGTKRTRLKVLAAHMEDWRSGPGGIDDRGLFAISTFNPNAKWDWYEIGGRWDGHLPGNVLSAAAL